MISKATDLQNGGGGQAVPPPKRPVILHFHTYKNAGSTVDVFLQSAFPGAWDSFDFHAVEEFYIHQSELVHIAANRPHLKAISSHQIRLPVPQAPKIDFLPIVFIRHPILRAASLWRFERGRADDHPRTILAREQGFAKWLSDGLDNNHYLSFCDIQSSIFAFAMNQRIRRADPTIPERAVANVTDLPFIGVVESFDRSMKIFEKLYASKVPEFRYKPVESVNVTGQLGKSLEEQLAEIHEQIGADIFEELIRRNASDLGLYQMAVKRLEEHRIEGE